jgi:WD40 repeat protein
VIDVAFSSDSQLLASGSSDRTIKLWNVHTGQCLNYASGQHQSRLFSPDGQRLVSGGDDLIVRTWDTATGNCLEVLEGHTKRIWSASFSPDGQTVISGSPDSTIKLWHSKTGECLRTLRSDQLYAGMDITGATGLTEAQKVTLMKFGRSPSKPPHTRRCALST